MFNRRCFRLYRAFAPASAAAVVVLFGTVSPSWAQKMAPTKEKKHGHKRDAELEKAIGKTDADLFNGVMNSFGDEKIIYHLVTDTTAEVKNANFTGSLSGHTEMRGSYGGAFAADSELTVHQGEQSVTVKTRFVCDGTTLWTYKPAENQYTEELVASLKGSLGKQFMESSFDLVAAIGGQSDDDDKPDENKMDSAKAETGLFKGVPSRVLTIQLSKKDDPSDKATIRVYLGTNKRLRGFQMTSKQGDAPFTITETVKVMETIPPPDKATFTFSPPAGAKKVEKFGD